MKKKRYLKGAEHGQERLCNDKTEEEVAEGRHCQPSGSSLQGLDLRRIQPSQWTVRPCVCPALPAPYMSYMQAKPARYLIVCSMQVLARYQDVGLFVKRRRPKCWDTL